MPIIGGSICLTLRGGVLRRRLGRAVQVDPIKPMLKAPGTKRLKLKYNKLLSSFAFKINLRRFTLAHGRAEGGDMPAAAALYYSRGQAHAGLAGSTPPRATRHVIHMDFEASFSIA